MRWKMVPLAIVWISFLTAMAVVPSVEAATRPDAWITTKAKIALLSEPDVGGMRINVDTVNGRVTLGGDVASEAEKQAAERTVRGIEGVTDVRNMLRVAPESAEKATDAEKAASAAVDDDALEEHVKRAIQADPVLAAGDIEVDSVESGIVTLDGDARSMTELRRALEKARAVAGVKGVRSEVDAPADLRDDEVWRGTDRADAKAGDARSASASPMTDMWITSATKVRLMANDRTPAMDINVDTIDGHVTLFGTVPDDEAKRAAEAEARKVDGVTQVDNRLQVVAAAKREAVDAKDEDLTEAVEKSIEGNPALEDSDIDVEVSNGVVRLTGEVDSQTERMSALTAARSVPGVRSAVDDLRIDADGDAAAQGKGRAPAARDDDLPKGTEEAPAR